MSGGSRLRKELREKNKKGLESQYENLLELTLLVHDHYPEIKTRNPYQRVINRLVQHHPADHQLLLIKLTHSLTALHHTTRYQNKTGQYESSREDVVSALQLLKNQLNVQTLLNKEERMFYIQLQAQFNRGCFTRQHVQERLAGSKTRTQAKLNKLYHANLVQRTGHTNIGYRYELK